MTIAVRRESKSIRFVGTFEILQRLGGELSRQHLFQITSDDDFPHPIATLAQGEIWLADDIERWILRAPPECWQR